MEALDGLLQGFAVAAQPNNLLYAAIGVLLGTAVGVLPGLGTVSTIAVLLPLTYGMDPASAIIMLAGIFYGAQYGGSTTSILTNIPGEATSVVTCLDGYQMARKGQAGAALGIAAIGSFIGGTLGVLGLSWIAPPLAEFALKFGPSEYFLLLLLGMTMIVYVGQGSVVKALLMGLFGLFLGMIGLDPVQGTDRFTFGQTNLRDGLDFVVVAMGLFGLAEILVNLEQREKREILKADLQGLLPPPGTRRKCAAAIGRGSFLGFLLGVLPGGGAIISSFMSYAVERRLSKSPETFGKGAIEGVASPESANNAASSSSFIPLFTLGVPGNATIAIILVALMIHGLRPGPSFIAENPGLFWAVVASMLIGNVMLLVLNLPLIGLWVKLLKVPYRYMAVIVVIACTVGAYSLRSEVFDVGTMVLFGLIGYLLRKAEFPLAPILLAMILGPMLERSLQQALIGSGGSFDTFVQSPISIALLCLLGGVLVSSTFGVLRKAQLMPDNERT